MLIATRNSFGETETLPKAPLKFTARQPNSTVKMTAGTGAPSVTLEHSEDGGRTWSPFVPNTTTIFLETVGDETLIRAGADGNATMADQVSAGDEANRFAVTGAVDVSGDITSLLDASAPVLDISDRIYCFALLFAHCPIVSAAGLALPSAVLSRHCYLQMFWDCTRLVDAPEIAATTLARWCCFQMFLGCASLISAPALPATKMEQSCYEYMFMNCTSLATAPALPATTLAPFCYKDMFQECHALVTAPTLPATTLEQSCYHGMFYGCHALVNAPELPATELKTQCYEGMFAGCHSLVYAPELPATTLATFCYGDMFLRCTSLRRVATRLTAMNDWMSGWLAGVPATGEFYCDTSALGDNETIRRGTSACPDGWTVKDISELKG